MLRSRVRRKPFHRQEQVWPGETWIDRKRERKTADRRTGARAEPSGQHSDAAPTSDETRNDADLTTDIGARSAECEGLTTQASSDF